MPLYPVKIVIKYENTAYIEAESAEEADKLSNRLWASLLTPDVVWGYADVHRHTGIAPMRPKEDRWGNAWRFDHEAEKFVMLTDKEAQEIQNHATY